MLASDDSMRSLKLIALMAFGTMVSCTHPESTDGKDESDSIGAGHIEVVTVTPETFASELRAEFIHVPRRTVLHVEADLNWSATRGILVEGRMIAPPRSASGADAPSITLSGGTAVLVTGNIEGGAGGDAPITDPEKDGGDERRAGAGSTVTLVGEEVCVTGAVMADAGGRGGTGSFGGNGGDLVVSGAVIEYREGWIAVLPVGTPPPGPGIVRPGAAGGGRLDRRTGLGGPGSAGELILQPR